ncbi:hypothetical protein [Haloarchaeobius sp. TZWWS8]|uniref:hypothetical protein n=1 Tax=Haloarchaeobius sp. TZWWS8 TaxID=3446121 RepID=UPI003EBF434A
MIRRRHVTVIALTALLVTAGCLGGGDDTTTSAGTDPGSESSPDSELDVRLQGDAQPGETVTVMVATPGGPVDGAAISVDGESVGETGADGTLEVQVPDDADTLTITVEKDGASTEVETTVEENAKS